MLTFDSNNIKNQIIPEAWKPNIDAILERELFNANRHYADSNLSRYIESEAIKRPSIFFKELSERWDWHNLFYEYYLERAFLFLFRYQQDEFTPRYIDTLLEIYRTCCLVDVATLVKSAAIKSHLNYYMKKMITFSCDTKYQANETFLLLTPPENNYFIEYHIDHLTYILQMKRNSCRSGEFKEYLLKKYHACDNTIFEGRFKRFSNYLTYTIGDIQKEISDLSISNEHKVQHLYFVLENPERKAYCNTLLYDNREEKYIAHTLIGISGFFFRKNILKILNNSNIMPNHGDIYEFSDVHIENALKELKCQSEHFMKKNVKFFAQHTATTCAISCLLMVLNYYNDINFPTPKMEFELYRRYGSKYTDGTPLSALAYHLAMNGYEVILSHSSGEFFDYSSSYFTKELFDVLMHEYTDFILKAEKKVIIRSGITINEEVIKHELEEDYLVILAGQTNDCLHTILVIGYDDDGFIVCDPMFSKIKMSREMLNRFICTPIGKWFISTKKTPRQEDELVEYLKIFQNDAHKYLEE